MPAARSLWLHPSKRAVRVRLDRFAWYPWFHAFLTARLGSVPEYATVRWLPYEDFTRYLIEADDEDHGMEIQGWIDDVERMIVAGDDVPPLVRDHGELADGRHRSFAAEAAGIALAPTIDLAELGRP